MSRTSVGWLLAAGLGALLVTMLPARVLAQANTWKMEDTEAIAKRRTDRLQRDAKEYGKALATVEQEETDAMDALEKAKAGAAEESKGDAAREKRLLAMGRTKAVAKLEEISAKYGRVYGGVKKFQAERGLPDEAIAELETVVVKIKSAQRGNRERVAALYEELGKLRKALGLYEAMYNAIPEKERGAEETLKTKISELKEKINGKREDGKGTDDPPPAPKAKTPAAPKAKAPAAEE